jgi:Ni,Fe-hydrogenase I large subunit
MRLDDFLTFIQRSGIPRKIARDYLMLETKKKNLKMEMVQRKVYVKSNFSEDEKQMIEQIYGHLKTNFWFKEHFVREMTQIQFPNENPLRIKHFIKVLEETRDDVKTQNIFGALFIYQTYFESEVEVKLREFHKIFTQFSEELKPLMSANSCQQDFLKKYQQIDNFYLKNFIAAFNKSDKEV